MGRDAFALNTSEALSALDLTSFADPYFCIKYRQRFLPLIVVNLNICLPEVRLINVL
jgi:hypothetical protein